MTDILVALVRRLIEAIVQALFRYYLPRLAHIR